MRFCDTIKIYRHEGELYDPFADMSEVRSEEYVENGIYSTLVYDGECKAEYKPTSIINEETKVVIYIEDNDVDVCVRDTAYLQSNGVQEVKKLQVTEVMHYARNTIIHALFLKDGENI